MVRDRILLSSGPARPLPVLLPQFLCASACACTCTPCAAFVCVPACMRALITGMVCRSARFLPMQPVLAGCA